MRITRATMIIALACLVAAGIAIADSPRMGATDRLWTEVSAANVAGPRAFELDLESLEDRLREAPEEFTTTEPLSVVTLPLPDGGFRSFAVERSSILESELHERHLLQTYKIRATDRAPVRGRVVQSPDRFSASVLIEGRLARIQRRTTPSGPVYVSYWDDSFVEDHGGCAMVESMAKAGDSSEGSSAGAGGGQGGLPAPVTLKPYRFAVATTPAFTASVVNAGDTVLNVVTDLVSDLNLIYENDLNIRLELIAETTALFFDERENPQPGSCATLDDGLYPCTLGVRGECAINAVIGAERYDAGHLLGKYVDFGLPSGCSTFPDNGACTVKKGRTVSMHPNPANPVLYTAAHESGHQFGGDHTHTACGGFRPGAGVEPGTGATIMSYPTFCPPDDISPITELYFHIFSINQIKAELADTADCHGTPIGTGNNSPDLAALANFGGIPRNTNFILDGSATDDLSSVIEYTWDQVDIAPAPSDPLIDDGEGDPIFRSGPLQANIAKRNFTDQNEPGYILPTTDRSLNLRLVARDGQGGVSDRLASFDVSGSQFRSLVAGTPTFKVTYGSQCDIEWDAGGAPGLGVQDVDIYVSGNGGLTFPSTPTATVPVTDEKIQLDGTGICPTANAIMRLEPVDTTEDFVFYAESVPFELECTGTCPATGGCPIGCRTSTFPTECPRAPIGAVSCDDGTDTLCCDTGQQIYERICECEPIIPGTLCPAISRSLSCDY